MTETLDVKKYFLDIDKIERFPISFVIKSIEPIETLRQKLEAARRNNLACKRSSRPTWIVSRKSSTFPFYRNDSAGGSSRIFAAILDEIVKQSKVEFNYSDETEAEIEDEEAGGSAETE